MPADNKVGIFSTKMRTEFQKAYQATADPAKYERFTQIIDSTARIEHYTWMSPSPGIARYQGHRRFGKIDVVRYTVENLEFDAAFEVLRRDIEDDQTGGYEIKPRELGERARKFPGRWVLKQAALGTSTACFDGTNFFANSHTIGIGDNLMAGTGTGNSDGLSYKMILFHHGGPLKPLIYQNRKPPEFRTDAGSPGSDLAKMVRYWIDMEGQMAFGYWWDAIHWTWTNRPNVVDMGDAFRQLIAQFRGYQLPKSLTSEDGEYIHEQTDFSSANLTLAVTPALEQIAKQAVNAEWIPVMVSSTPVANTNLYKGLCEIVATNFL
jgi:phage major head subunit gpT-like protein